MEFPSELVPNYESSTFIIRDFDRIRHSHEVVYSEPLIFNGLTWRLKVYPNGNGIAKGNYISIFLAFQNLQSTNIGLKCSTTESQRDFVSCASFPRILK